MQVAGPLESEDSGAAPQSSHSGTADDGRPPLHTSIRAPPASVLRTTTVTTTTSLAGGSPSKTVSFACDSPKLEHSAHASPMAQESSVSGGDFGWDDNSDGQSSMSGYSAYSGRRASDAEPNTFYSRLVRFYRKYNPEKLGRAQEFLQAYKGDEELLFKNLVLKYGPEPGPDEDVHATSTMDGRSDTGSMFFLGERWALPKEVSPMQGRTDIATPYWPGNRLIADTDLLALLRNLRTENEELGRCFIGVLAQHPLSSFNGLVYVTKALLPSNSDTNAAGPDGRAELFLDHHWAGRLANNKSLVHQNANFTRTVLHCTDECQHHNSKIGAHERWRLTIYRWDSSPLSLYRVIWDPVIAERSEVPGSPSQSNSSGAPARSSDIKVKYPTHRRPIEQPVQPATLSRPPTHQDPHDAAGAPVAVQRPSAEQLQTTAVPQQLVALFDGMLRDLETRLDVRLSALERRLAAMESKK